MKHLRENLKSLFLFTLKLTIGILLLVDPVGLTGSIILGFGILCCLYALVRGITYFRKPPAEAAMEQDLFKGMIALAFGLFCLFRSEWFLSTFPLLTIVYGLGFLLDGFIEIQWTIDMLRMKKIGWIPSLISAAISLLIAVFVLFDPFTTTDLLWTFAGIALIASAIPDLLVLFLVPKLSKSTPSASANEPAKSDE